MDRRHFLQATATGTAALVLPVASWWTAPPAEWQALARPALLNMLGTQRVCEIGICYRKTYPAEDSLATLHRTLLTDARLTRQLPSSLTAYLEQQTRDDFKAGRTVLLEGWVLACTEARQCALFSILSA